ncbi:MAG: cytochrome c oxidase subunit 3 [Pseudomonadales bacterium]|jgi:cytochrome c oxidase subunit 3
MSIIVLFIFVAVGTSYWWLWRNKIFAKPWLLEGTKLDTRDDIGNIGPSARTALIVFLAVVTSMFSLFISAYFMRMALGDWQAVNEPQLLWFNTVLLILGSISIHWCSRAAASANLSTVRITLLSTGLFTCAFIFFQLLAWRQLVADGYYLQSNPANAFFYLFTGIHGLHLLGGLFVWLRTTIRAFTVSDMEQTRLSVELCRTYWHFLLVVWLVIFSLLLST